MSDQNQAAALGAQAEAGVEHAASGTARGTPSQHLQQSGLITPGDQAGGGEAYESITDAASEQGIYPIVGGYLDDGGEVHSVVHLRSMSGEEEDLLGNRAVPMLDRLNAILKQCTKQIGTISDRGQINQAIERMPIGSRMHMIVCLRRTTHWRRQKDIFDMEVRCPYNGCEKEQTQAIDLSSIETYDMPNPDKREHRLKLSDCGSEVVWRVASLAQEKMLDLVTDKDDSAALTYAIVVRMISVDEKDVRVGLTDMLTTDHKKLRMSPKAQSLFQWAKKLSVNDREELRASFLNEEPGIDTNIDFECSHCNKKFSGTLGIAQESFWFPSSASKRLKMKSSI